MRCRSRERRIQFEPFNLQDCRPKGVSDKLEHGDSDVMDAKTLPQVKMPNRDNFFPEFPKLMPQRP